jgi:hypothetical protein
LAGSGHDAAYFTGLKRTGRLHVLFLRGRRKKAILGTTWRRLA